MSGYEATKATINALERGWTPEEIALGTRVRPNDEWFTCPTCGTKTLKRLAMYGSFGAVCESCFMDSDE